MEKHFETTYILIDKRRKVHSGRKDKHDLAINIHL